MSADRAFSVDLAEQVPPDQTLLVGLSHLGMGSLTAVDHLVRTQDSEQVGRVAPAELPGITPIENGAPRHHTRLYNLTGHDLIVLVGELFVPPVVASSFAEVMATWMQAQSVEEVAILHGVPYPHAPEDHDVFYVATDAYRDRHEDALSMKPMTGGYLDGVAGEVVTRNLDGVAPPTGVFITPTHPPGPDVEAALRFVDVVESVYGLTVDRTELEELSEEIQAHYANLADRMAAVEEQERAAMSGEFRDDRMFM